VLRARSTGCSQRPCCSGLQPWLIEVNTGPSLSAPSALDMHIKHRMVANLFNLVGFVPYDKTRFEAEKVAARQAKLTGVPTSATSAKKSGAGAKWARAGAAAAVTAAVHSGRVRTPGAAASSSASSAGSADASLFPKKRDIRALEGISFDKIPLADLPEIIQEAEAELARAGEFERCFPCSAPADNEYYLQYFDAPRFDNVLLCKWEVWPAE